MKKSLTFFITALVLLTFSCSRSGQKNTITYNSEYDTDNIPETKKVSHGYFLKADDLPELEDSEHVF